MYMEPTQRTMRGSMLLGLWTVCIFVSSNISSAQQFCAAVKTTLLHVQLVWHMCGCFMFTCVGAKFELWKSLSVCELFWLAALRASASRRDGGGLPGYFVHGVAVWFGRIGCLDFVVVYYALPKCSIVFMQMALPIKCTFSLALVNHCACWGQRGIWAMCMSKTKYWHWFPWILRKSKHLDSSSESAGRPEGSMNTCPVWPEVMYACCSRLSVWQITLRFHFTTMSNCCYHG